MNTESNNTSCIFIPLANKDVMLIRAWIHRLAPTKDDDEKLAEQINIALTNTFELHKLTYREETYGKYTVDRIRLQLGSDGICIPEVCFLNPPAHLKRVEASLKPFSQTHTQLPKNSSQ